MGQWVEKGGERFYVADDGSLTSGEQPGLIAQAGRQFADIGSGAQMLWGNLSNNPELVAQAEADTAARNALFEYADQAYPIESMFGQALPGIATFPASGLRAGMALGALEGAFDVSEPGNWAQRGAAGAAGALVGEAAGRILGRVVNLGEGISQALAGRRLAANPQAEAYEQLVGETTAAYSRMTPDTLGQRVAESVTQGAEASFWGSPQARFAVQKAALNQAASDAVGVPLPADGVLDKAWRKAALDRFERGFAEVQTVVQPKGNMQVAGSLRNVLADMPAIKELQNFGLFAGLDKKGEAFLSGREWYLARQALGEYAAEAKPTVQGRYYGLIDELDTWMERQLKDAGPEFTDMFKRLREQYRVFSQLDKPNVINQEGDINIRSLSRALENKTSGFGRTATAGKGAEKLTDETNFLLELVEAADKPKFQPFKTSGTAERFALDRAAEAATGAAEDLMTGNTPGALAKSARFFAPLAAGPMEMGGGLPYDYMFNRASPGSVVRGGAGIGRGALDQEFYPFVGIEDDRRP